MRFTFFVLFRLPLALDLVDSLFVLGMASEEIERQVAVFVVFSFVLDD